MWDRKDFTVGNSTNPSSTTTLLRTVPVLNRSERQVNEVEVNGVPVTRDTVKRWLKAKKTTLWCDWCVSDPSRMELAVDWFMREMADVSGFTA